jgi:cell division transport system permease protein
LDKWLGGSDALKNYIPQMIEVRAESKAALSKIAKEAAAAKLRWTSASAATPDRAVGIKIMLLSGLVFLMVLAALGACIIHSVKNIILIHKREIEILNQVGATPRYIAGQIQKAILGIAAKGCLMGWLVGAVMLMLINGLSRGTGVGLLAHMKLSGADWLATLALAVAIVILISVITRAKALSILRLTAR